jgi:hypothetical protein
MFGGGEVRPRVYYVHILYKHYYGGGSDVLCRRWRLAKDHFSFTRFYYDLVCYF